MMLYFASLDLGVLLNEVKVEVEVYVAAVVYVELGCGEDGMEDDGVSVSVSGRRDMLHL